MVEVVVVVVVEVEVGVEVGVGAVVVVVVGAVVVVVVEVGVEVGVEVVVGAVEQSMTTSELLKKAARELNVALGDHWDLVNNLMQEADRLEKATIIAGIDFGYTSGIKEPTKPKPEKLKPVVVTYTGSPVELANAVFAIQGSHNTLIRRENERNGYE